MNSLDQLTSLTVGLNDDDRSMNSEPPFILNKSSYPGLPHHPNNEQGINNVGDFDDSQSRVEFDIEENSQFPMSDSSTMTTSLIEINEKLGANLSMNKARDLGNTLKSKSKPLTSIRNISKMDYRREIESRKVRNTNPRLVEEEKRMLVSQSEFFCQSILPSNPAELFAKESDLKSRMNKNKDILTKKSQYSKNSGMLNKKVKVQGFDKFSQEDLNNIMAMNSSVEMSNNSSRVDKTIMDSRLNTTRRVAETSNNNATLSPSRNQYDNKNYVESRNALLNERGGTAAGGLSEKDRCALKLGRLLLTSILNKEDITTSDSVSRFFVDNWLSKLGSSSAMADTYSIELLCDLQRSIAQANTDILLHPMHHGREESFFDDVSHAQTYYDQEDVIDKLRVAKASCSLSLEAFDNLIKEFGPSNPVLVEIRDSLLPSIFCDYNEPDPDPDPEDSMRRSTVGTDSDNPGMTKSRLSGQKYMQFKTWSDTVNELTTELQEKDETLLYLTQDRDQYKYKVSELFSQIDSMSSQSIADRKSHKDISERQASEIQKQSTEIESLRSEVSSLKAAHKQDHHTIKNYEFEVAVLKSKIHTLNDEFQAANIHVGKMIQEQLDESNNQYFLACEARDKASAVKAQLEEDLSKKQSIIEYFINYCNDSVKDWETFVLRHNSTMQDQLHTYTTERRNDENENNLLRIWKLTLPQSTKKGLQKNPAAGTDPHPFLHDKPALALITSIYGKSLDIHSVVHPPMDTEALGYYNLIGDPHAIARIVSKNLKAWIDNLIASLLRVNENLKSTQSLMNNKAIQMQVMDENYKTQIIGINQRFEKEIRDMQRNHSDYQKQSQWKYTALAAEKRVIATRAFDLEEELRSVQKELKSLDDTWLEKCKVMIESTNLSRDQAEMASHDLAYFKKCEHYDALHKDHLQLQRSHTHQEYMIGNLRDSLTVSGVEIQKLLIQIENSKQNAKELSETIARQRKQIADFEKKSASTFENLKREVERLHMSAENASVIFQTEFTALTTQNISLKDTINHQAKTIEVQRVQAKKDQEELKYWTESHGKFTIEWQILEMKYNALEVVKGKLDHTVLTCENELMRSEEYAIRQDKEWTNSLEMMKARERLVVNACRHLLDLEGEKPKVHPKNSLKPNVKTKFKAAISLLKAVASLSDNSATSGGKGGVQNNTYTKAFDVAHHEFTNATDDEGDLRHSHTRFEDHAHDSLTPAEDSNLHHTKVNIYQEDNQVNEKGREVLNDGGKLEIIVDDQRQNQNLANQSKQYSFKNSARLRKLTEAGLQGMKDSFEQMRAEGTKLVTVKEYMFFDPAFTIVLNADGKAKRLAKIKRDLNLSFLSSEDIIEHLIAVVTEKEKLIHKLSSHLNFFLNQTSNPPNMLSSSNPDSGRNVNITINSPNEIMYASQPASSPSNSNPVFETREYQNIKMSYDHLLQEYTRLHDQLRELQMEVTGEDDISTTTDGSNSVATTRTRGLIKRLFQKHKQLPTTTETTNAASPTAITKRSKSPKVGGNILSNVERIRREIRDARMQGVQAEGRPYKLIQPFISVIRQNEKQYSRESAMMKIAFREAERMCIRINSLLAKLQLNIDEYGNPNAGQEYSEGVRTIRAEMKQEMGWIFVKNQQSLAAELTEPNYDPVTTLSHMQMHSSYQHAARETASRPLEIASSEDNSNEDDIHEMTRSRNEAITVFNDLTTNLYSSAQETGGWFSLLYNSDGTIDRNIDLTIWPDEDKVKILTEIADYERRERELYESETEESAAKLKIYNKRLEAEKRSLVEDIENLRNEYGLTADIDRDFAVYKRMKKLILEGKLPQFQERIYSEDDIKTLSDTVNVVCTVLLTLSRPSVRNRRHRQNSSIKPPADLQQLTANGKDEIIPSNTSTDTSTGNALGESTMEIRGDDSEELVSSLYRKIIANDTAKPWTQSLDNEEISTALSESNGLSPVGREIIGDYRSSPGKPTMTDGHCNFTDELKTGLHTVEDINTSSRSNAVTPNNTSRSKNSALAANANANVNVTTTALQSLSAAMGQHSSRTSRREKEKKLQIPCLQPPTHELQASTGQHLLLPFTSNKKSKPTPTSAKSKQRHQNPTPTLPYINSDMRNSSVGDPAAIFATDSHTRPSSPIAIGSAATAAAAEFMPPFSKSLVQEIKLNFAKKVTPVTPFPQRTGNKSFVDENVHDGWKKIVHMKRQENGRLAHFHNTLQHQQHDNNNTNTAAASSSLSSRVPSNSTSKAIDKSSSRQGSPIPTHQREQEQSEEGDLLVADTIPSELDPPAPSPAHDVAVTSTHDVISKLHVRLYDACNEVAVRVLYPTRAYNDLADKFDSDIMSRLNSVDRNKNFGEEFQGQRFGEYNYNSIFTDSVFSIGSKAYDKLLGRSLPMYPSIYEAAYSNSDVVKHAQSINDKLNSHIAEARLLERELHELSVNYNSFDNDFLFSMDVQQQSQSLESQGISNHQVPKLFESPPLSYGHSSRRTERYHHVEDTGNNSSEDRVVSNWVGADIDDVISFDNDRNDNSELQLASHESLNDGDEESLLTI